MAVAFVLGVETAGDVQPVVHETQAGGTVLEGDLDGNGALELSDLRIALELARGDRSPAPKELAADPDQDFRFTMEDALLILQKLEITR